MSKHSSFPDFPDLSRLPQTFTNTTTPQIPRTDEAVTQVNLVNGNSQTPFYLTDTLYIYDFLTKTKVAVETRTKYYDEVIEKADTINKSHLETMRMIRTLLWYSFISTIFSFILLILITFLSAYLFSPSITNDTVLDFTKGLSGLASFGGIAAFINFCFLKNLFNKFKEVDNDIKNIKEDLTKIKTNIQ